MKIFKALLLSLLLFSLLAVSAYAIEGEVTFDYDTQMLKMEAVTTKPYSAVSVRIAKISSDDELSGINSTNISDIISYVNTFDSDAQGKVEEEIYFSKGKSMFKASMSDEDGNSCYKVFATFDEEEKAGIFERIKACSDQYIQASDDYARNSAIADFIGIIDEFYPVYNILYDEFNSLGAEEKKLVSSIVLKSGVEEVSVMENLFSNNTAMQYVLTKSANENFNSDVENMQQYLLYPPARAYYTSLTQQQKALAISLANCDGSSYDSLCDSLSAAILRYKISSTTWTYVKNILEEYSDYLENSLSSTSMRESSEKFRELICATTGVINFATIDGFIKTANEYNNSSNNPTLNGGNFGGGGAGSGGGGGGAVGGGSTPSIYYPAEASPVQQGFGDLNEVGWAVESINYLRQRGIVSGRSDSVFDPASGVTREEFIKMLVTALGFETGSTEVEFEDVDKKAWYYGYVSAAVERNLIKGISQNEYGVGKYISRQDIVTVIYRALGESETEYSESEFADSDKIADYALPAVGFAAKKGLVKGKNDNKFEPESNLTRAEAAVILHRVVLYTQNN